MAFSAQRTVHHTPAETAEALASEEFHRSVIESLGGTLVSFSREGDAEGPMTVTTVRSAPARQLPEAAQKFIGDHVQVEQVERWEAPEADGSRSGTTTITVAKAKATAEASMHLRAAGAGTEYAVQGSLSCRIPLVGSKLAAKAEPMVGKVVERQAREIDGWLSTRRG